MRAIFVCLLVAPLALCQEFEVVSVKPSTSADNGSSMNSNLGGLTATNASLRNLIVMGYGLKDYQLEAPDWMSSQRFDLAAKFPEALPKDREKYNEQLHAMIRNMLVDRFKLEVHRDSKPFSVYGLVVAKGGIKFKQVPDSDSHNQNNNNRHYTGTCVSMSSFADFLARRMDLPVLDMTGLTGFYDLTLDWVPEPRQPADGKSDAVPLASEPSGPTLPVAIQEQLGLRFEPRRASIEVLIVDHAERVPTGN